MNSVFFATCVVTQRVTHRSFLFHTNYLGCKAYFPLLKVEIDCTLDFLQNNFSFKIPMFISENGNKIDLFALLVDGVWDTNLNIEYTKRLKFSGCVDDVMAADPYLTVSVTASTIDQSLSAVDYQEVNNFMTTSELHQEFSRWFTFSERK